MDSKVISESGNNYVKYGNGLLIQWGRFAAGATTFPKPFKNTTYRIATALFDGGSHTTNPNFYNKTTTGFSGQYGSGEYEYIAIGY